jgi:hypothetical protein
MARLLAGQGKTVLEIQAQVHVPESVARTALANPMRTSDPQSAEAAELLADKTGGGAELHRIAEEAGPLMTVLGNPIVDLLAEMEKDSTVHKGTVDELRREFRSRVPRMYVAIDTYKALEAEHDAFGVEKKIKAGLGK